MPRVKLTEAQLSALQSNEGGLEPLIDRLWHGGRTITFSSSERWALVDELTELSNSEDAHAQMLQDRGQPQDARWARGASTALANLSTKVAKA
jgi:hypothetical protein